MITRHSINVISRFFVLGLAAFLLSSCALLAQPAERDAQVTRLADGIYAIRHVGPNDINVSGNTTVIIGDREVLVVDSCYLPSQARHDIAQIRQWTDKPVAYLLNTHFHNDHNNGNRAYLEAFPSIAIVAHEETRKDMDMIQPGNIERTPKQLAATIAAFKAGKTKDGRALTEEDKQAVQKILPNLEKNEAEFRAMKYQAPTLMFADHLEIDLGNRMVQIKHLGRGNTPGDAIAYLPKEKILVAGDVLVHPIPYTFDGYPAEWVHTLEKMALLDTEITVPGHGPVLHDKAYLNLVTDLMRSCVEQVRARISQLGHPAGHTLDEIKGSVDLTSFRSRFAGEDQQLQAEFDEMAGHLVKTTFSEAQQR